MQIFPSKRHSTNHLFICGLLFMSSILVIAEDSPTLFVQSNLVQMVCLVENKDHQPLINLNKSDFSVAQDGKTVPVEQVRTQQDVSASIVLLVDVSESQKGNVELFQKTLTQFARSLKENRDQVTVLLFAGKVWKASGWMNTKELEAFELDSSTIKKVEATPPLSEHGFAHGTHIFEAINAATRIMEESGIHDRKEVVALTDGGDSTGPFTYLKALEAAKKANVSISALLFQETDLDDRVDPIAKFFRVTDTRLSGDCAGSGGISLKVNAKNEDQQIHLLVAALTTQYIVDFKPRLKGKNSFHSVRIKVDRPGAVVIARDGFYEPAS